MQRVVVADHEVEARRRPDVGEEVVLNGIPDRVPSIIRAAFALVVPLSPNSDRDVDENGEFDQVGECWPG